MEIISKKYSLLKNNKITIGIGCDLDPTISISEECTGSIGDHCYFGPGVRIGPGRFSTGDYSKFHQNTYINPLNFVELGHLTWFGQGSIIDGTGGIKAGNFLGAGINSALYSHIRHGDTLEGCSYDQNKKLIVGDDVWFVGMCLVSPVNVGNKSMALLGSVIIKNMEENHIYGGNPATDLTSKIGSPWKLKPTDQKMSELCQIIDEFCIQNKSISKDEFEVVDSYPTEIKDKTMYNVTDRTYTKRNTPNEIKLNKYIFKYKAKFIPKV